jgi:hypothetical protein
LTIAIPEANTDGVDLVKESAFQPAPSWLRMIRGLRAEEGQPEKFYGLAAGATG